MKFTYIMLLLGLFFAGCGTSSIIPKQEKNPVVLSEDESSLIEDGINYHDKGKYEKAIKSYLEVTKVNPDNVAALYELAYSYFSKGDYNSALDYSLKALEYKSEYVSKLYMIAGNSLDMLKKPDDAIKVYREGIEIYPKESMLYFNLGITLYNQKKVDEAIKNMLKAIELSKTNASAQLALGKIYFEQGKQIESLVCLLRFLVLEPFSYRSENALMLFNEMLKKGISKKDKSHIDLKLFGFSNDESPYGMVEMIYKLGAVNIVTNDSLSGMEGNRALFKVLISTLTDKKREINIADDLLYMFLVDVKENKFSDDLFYFISLKTEDPVLIKLLAEKKEQLLKFGDWVHDYDWNKVQ